jgi:hypothetical protein
VPDAGFHLAFPVGIADPAGHGDDAVVSQHVAIERIQSGIVNIGLEYAAPFERAEQWIPRRNWFGGR